MRRAEKLLTRVERDNEADASELITVDEESEPRSLMAKLTREMGRKIERRLSEKSDFKTR